MTKEQTLTDKALLVLDDFASWLDDPGTDHGWNLIKMGIYFQQLADLDDKNLVRELKQKFTNMIRRCARPNPFILSGFREQIAKAQAGEREIAALLHEIGERENERTLHNLKPLTNMQLSPN